MQWPTEKRTDNANNTQVNSCQSSSPPVVSVIRIAQSLVFCALFCRSLSVLFSVGHCIVCLFFKGQVESPHHSEDLVLSAGQCMTRL
jgi:hypothetical protein